ncbi:MAG: VOC family protein [Propionibacteriales bacterium]|nr:VOC family protein [Propionibacteriales bacterium]
MRLDHLSFAAGPDGLAATTDRLSELLGEKFHDGGIHPRFGTRNMILPLTQGQFIEIVEVLDHPASDKAAFGQAVRARSESGGGWLGWVVAVDDIATVESRLDRQASPGNRHRPDGVELRWKQIGVESLRADPQLPFFVEWQSPVEQHPSVGATGHLELAKVEIAGDAKRVASWLDTSDEYRIGTFEIGWTPPNGVSGILAVSVATPDGIVRI